MASKPCNSTRDVSDDTLFPDLDDAWHCPRTAICDGEYCLYEMSPTHAARRQEDLTETFLHSIYSPTESESAHNNSPNRFIGAALPTLDLSYQVLRGQTTHSMDLRNATIRGDMMAARRYLVPNIAWWRNNSW